MTTVATHPALTIRALDLRTVLVPLRRPLHTSGGVVAQAPLVLIDLQTDQGITGSTYLFCYTPLALAPVAQLLANLRPQLQGQAVAPLELGLALQRQFRLLGAKGVVAMALAGLDMAAWDALAKARGVPLAVLLGGGTGPIRAYNSNGLGLIGPARAADEAQALVAEGFGAIKIRLGYPSLAHDLEVVRAVRGAVGDGVELMSDYNQSLSVAEALQRCDALAAEGLRWIEEPTLADDFDGHARIRAKSRVPIQMGENWWGPHEMARCLAAGGSDLVMPDAMKIGGVSGWLHAAALAAAAGLPMSTHLFPEVSVHLMAATPTRHWLEFVDWAAPILAEPLTVRDGQVAVPERPGSGIAWDEAAVKRCLVG
jgi:mandelate racemase